MQSFLNPGVEAKEEPQLQTEAVVLAAQLSEIHSLLLQVAAIKIPYLYEDVSEDSWHICTEARMYDFHYLLGGYNESLIDTIAEVLNSASKLIRSLTEFDEYTKQFKKTEDYLDAHNYFSLEDPTKNKALKDAINAHHQLLIDVGPLMDNLKTIGMAYVQNLIRNKTNAFVSEHQIQEVFAHEFHPSELSSTYDVQTGRYHFRERVKTLFSMCETGMKKIVSDAHSEVLAFIASQRVVIPNQSLNIQKKS